MVGKFWVMAALIVMNSTAQAANLSQYKWQNRLLIIAADDGSSLFDSVKVFADSNLCDLKDRKLLVLPFSKGGEEWKVLPTSLQNKDGLYLIGLDGGVKDYSRDTALLKRLNQTIDAMPMRSRELVNNKASNC